MPETRTMQSMILKTSYNVVRELLFSMPREFFSQKTLQWQGGDRYGSRGGVYCGGRGGHGSDDRGSFNDRKRSKYGPALRIKSRLINVENVSSRTGWEDLKHLFRPLLKWPTLKPTRKSREKDSWSSILNKILTR